jgi:hypothetical protein
VVSIVRRSGVRVSSWDGRVDCVGQVSTATDHTPYHGSARTRGIDLNNLIGARFTLQGIEFEGICECKPCYWMDLAIAPGAEAVLQGRGGLRA